MHTSQSTTQPTIHYPCSTLSGTDGKGPSENMFVFGCIISLNRVEDGTWNLEPNTAPATTKPERDDLIRQIKCQTLSLSKVSLSTKRYKTELAFYFLASGVLTDARPLRSKTRIMCEAKYLAQLSVHVRCNDGCIYGDDSVWRTLDAALNRGD